MNILKKIKPWGRFYSILNTILTVVLTLILIMQIFTSYGENSIIFAIVAITYVIVNVLSLRIEFLTNQVNALIKTQNEEANR